MAVHSRLEAMAVDAINEYLEASASCLNATKPDGGCLGYPATLLLFCVTNALGVYLASDAVMIDGRPHKLSRGPFRVLNHQCFGLSLTGKQIDQLADSYRNRLAHNAIIEFGSCLVRGPHDGAPFIFTSPTSVGINVISFYGLVSTAWERFPKDRIKSWADQYSKSKLERMMKETT
jgi:hypothetical protein